MSRKRAAFVIFLTNICLEITLVMGIVCGPTFERLFGLSKTELGISLGASNIGMLTMSLLVGYLTQRQGFFPTFIFGLCGIITGTTIIIFSNGFPVLFCGLALIGVSGAFIANANATLLADLFQDKLRRIMSLASALWFVSSALSAPIIGIWLQFASNLYLDRWSFRIPYLMDLFFAGVCLFLGISVLRKITNRLKSEKAEHLSRTTEEKVSGPSYGKSWTWIPALATLHGFMMIVLMTWVNPMGQAKFGANEFQGSLLFGIMALGIASGRLILALIDARWDDRIILAFSSITGGTVFAVALTSKTYLSTVVLMGVGGLISCVTYPCILSLVGSKFTPIKAKLYGYMQASLGLAGLVGPSIVGILADHGVLLWHAIIISPVSAYLLGIFSLLWRVRNSHLHL